MNLQAEKLEAVKLIVDTGDIDIIRKVKSLFKNSNKTNAPVYDLAAFYEGFRNGAREVKASVEGKAELKDAKTWLDELQG